jgi:hypothetical protein
MKRPEPMKNLWVVSTPFGALGLMHRLTPNPVHAAPISNRVNALISQGILELSRSGASPVSC